MTHNPSNTATPTATAQYIEMVADMAWMYTPEYGFHTIDYRDADPDYQWAVANLIGFASYD